MSGGHRADDPRSLKPSDPVSTILSWVSSRGIEVRVWPAGDGEAEGGAPPHPILYLVDADAAPPVCSDGEDWVRRPLDFGEVRSRCDRLVQVARETGTMVVRVDDDDVLHVGEETWALSHHEARLLRLLIEHLGTVVDRTAMAEALWPDRDPSDHPSLNNPIRRLRTRLRSAPLELRNMHGRGLLLVGPTPSTSEGSAADLSGDS